MKAAALQALTRRATRWVSRTLLEPRLPLLAVEVRPRALAAVRMSEERGRLAVAAAASLELPAGALEVTLTKPNVLDAGVFRATLRAVLERVGALSGGPVALVLPDVAVRLTLIPAEGVRGREAEATVRYRLHKALPFEVRTARLAWRSVGGEQVLVAVAPEEVARDYEDALESLGFQPGLVEAASLALADAVADSGTDRDRLLVNWDQGYVSFVVLRGGQPLLVRTLAGEDAADSVARQAAGTLQFHQDRLGGQAIAEILVRSGALPGEEALGVLERATGITPRLVEPWAVLGIRENGGAVQAVAGAAACVLRRAA